MTRTKPCPRKDDTGMLFLCIIIVIGVYNYNVNIVGNATRKCIGDQMWGNTDVLQCQSLTITLIAEEVSVLI